MRIVILLIMCCLQNIICTMKPHFKKIKHQQKITKTTYGNILPITKNYRDMARFNGTDERYVGDEGIDMRIYDYIQKKNTLDILQNNKISIQDKLDYLLYFAPLFLKVDNTVKPTNLQSGGLLDDFYFDFEA